MEEVRREMDEQYKRMGKVRGEINEDFAKYQGLVKNQLEEITRDVLRPIEMQESMELIFDPTDNERERMEENARKMEEMVAHMKKLKAAVSEKLEGLEERLKSFDPKASPAASVGTTEGADGKSSDRTERDKEVEEILEHTAVEKMHKKYEGLPWELKMCLLCFSIFPMGKIIEKKVLIYWWIGERFARETGDRSAEEVGEEYLQKLIDQEFVLPVYNKRRGSILKSGMHPYVRWLIIKLARDEGFFNLDETGTPSLEPSPLGRACLFTKNEQGLLEKPYPRDPLSSKKSNHPHTPPSSKESPQSPEKPTTLLFNVNVKCVKLDKDSLPKFKGLVVLQLGRWVGSHNDDRRVEGKDPEKNDNLRQHIEMEEPEILDNLGGLLKLRYLSLRGMSRIMRLPTWIGACRHLQILDLKGCQNLSELTEDIKSLEKLTRLDVSECYMLEQMPKALSCLFQLTVLKGFVFGGSPSSSHACKISDLAKLAKLRKLSISINNVEKGSKDLNDLKKIKNLKILTITWSGEEPALTLPPNLVKLDLRCFPGERLGDWLQPKNLTKLKKVYIRGGKKLGHLGLEEYGEIKTLRLKYLELLEIREPEIEELRKKLDYLEIYECPKITVSYPFDLDGVWVNDNTPATMTSAPASASVTASAAAPPVVAGPTLVPASASASASPSVTASAAAPPAVSEPTPAPASASVSASAATPPDIAGLPDAAGPGPAPAPASASASVSASVATPPDIAGPPDAAGPAPAPASASASVSASAATPPDIAGPPDAPGPAPAPAPSPQVSIPPSPTTKQALESTPTPPSSTSTSVPTTSIPPATQTPSVTSISPPPATQTPSAPSISPSPATQTPSAPSISPPPALQIPPAPSISPPPTTNS
ncbi:hypothetical protein ACLOJK_020587 [Asimina triloba]